MYSVFIIVMNYCVQWMDVPQNDYEDKLASLKSELDELHTEKEDNVGEVRRLQEQLRQAEERYDRLMEGKQGRVRWKPCLL